MASGSEGRCGAAVAVLCAATATVATAARADDSEAIRVVFDAPAACPNEAEFIGQIIARTARARVAGPAEAARTFAIAIALEGTKAHGRLTITDGKGSPAVREVSGGTCEEVVSALGLVTALAIDPRASTAPKVSRSTPAASPPEPRPRAPPAPPPRYDALPWWGPIGAPLPAIPAPAPAPGWRAGWGVLVGGASAVAPGLVFTLAGFAEVARVGAGVLSPAFRLAMVQADSGFRAVGAGQRARFALGSGRFEGCPLRAEIVPSLTALPCVRFDAGELTAGGLARVGLTQDRPWAALGTGARIEWVLFGRLRLEAEASVNFPLVRDTFSFGVPPGPVSEVHAVPAAGGAFAAGAGTHFP